MCLSSNYLQPLLDSGRVWSDGWSQGRGAEMTSVGPAASELFPLDYVLSRSILGGLVGGGEADGKQEWELRGPW